MIFKVATETVSLSMAPTKDSEKTVIQEPSVVYPSSTPKNTSGIETTKTRGRKSKGEAKQSSNAEQSSKDPGDKSAVHSAITKDDQLSCASKPVELASTASKVDRYNGLVVKGKRKIKSRQEIRAQKAAEAKALLQSANEKLKNGLGNGNEGTPIRACSTPKEELSQRSFKVQFAAENSPVLSEGKARTVSAAVAKSIQLYSSVSKKWTTAIKEGAVNLQNFVGLKIDKDGNLAKHLDYTAMIYLSDFSDVLKSMGALCYSLEESLQSVVSSKLSDEVRRTFKPFNGIHLHTIVETLREICKGYSSEFDDKRAACTKLMNACFHEDDKEDCTRQLNNIVNVWNTDIHITRIDPRLETYYEEMKASGWH